ncbi:MAG TPA: chemotaxis protein CheA [Candidatus Latescibacteria bacterium]|nr:chemotaxis protein CheA [Candidatus Latescibacterota bacterium]
MPDGQELEHFAEIVVEFAAETQELLEQLEEDLFQLEAGDGNPELLNEIFRILHTIKGTSGFLNFDRMRLLAHSLEDLLGQLRDGKREVTREVMDLLLAGLDRLRELLAQVRQGNSDDGVKVEDIVEAAGRLSKAEKKAREVDDDLLRDFLAETEELLEGLEEHLLKLEARPEDPELLNEIFRAFHTIKGTSGFLGFSRTFQLAHRAEEVLDRLRKGDMVIGRDTMDALLAVLDVMKALLREIQEERGERSDIDPAIAMLEAFLEGKTAGVQKAEPTPAQVPLARAGVETIRVDVRRLDQLMNLVGELVLGRNRLLQLNSEIGVLHKGEEIAEQLDLTASRIDLLTAEIQEMVMKTRMVPVGRVFNKFPRVVRDLCRVNGKEVRLVIEGEDTELDKTVIEEIGDPLVHLIRNAIDHGIEPPEERVRLGKPRQGVVRLYAAQEGDHILVRVEDDGRGMDTEKIKRKAMEKGLLGPEEAGRMDDRAIWNLVFLPGFSTAERVTDVSGRGVGMDVVHTNITRLNGTISIDSQPGKGTRVEIRLPLTLAIVQGLVVRVGDELYALPLASVMEAVRAEAGDIRTINRLEVICLRDQVLPLVRLDRLFKVPDGGGNGRRYVVVVGTAEDKVGLVVHDLVGQEEVVIKSLGRMLQNTPAIAGATIRGDGKVCLIVDVNELLELAREQIR